MNVARSNTGCWTCRVRRKKCSEERPTCSICDSLSISCHGYGEKPSWMDGGEGERAEAASVKRAVKENYKRKKQHGKLPHAIKQSQSPSLAGDSPVGSESNHSNHQKANMQMSQDEESCRSFTGFRSPLEAPGSSISASESHHNAQLPIININMATSLISPMSTSDPVHYPSLPSCLSCRMTRLSGPYYGREATLLMHYLDNVFPMQFKFYNPLISEGGRGWLLNILLGTKPLYHAALSLSAYHQSSILPLHTENGSDRNLLRDLEKHYSMALTELRHHIGGLSLAVGSGRMTTRLEILACMIQLVSFEVFRGGNNEWQTHLQAARALFMEIRDSFTMPITSSDSTRQQHANDTTSLESLSPDEILALDFFASALVWFDILSSVTTGLKPKYPDVFSSLLYIEDGRIQLCKLMGCKNWVMVIIMDIATLSEWKVARQRTHNLSLPELFRRAASIEERLKTGLLDLQQWPLDPQVDPCGIRTLESQYVTNTFACAAQTYLHVVQSGAYPEIIEIKSSVVETIKAFRNLPDARWVRHLVWPFCIAGCMAGEEHEDDFRQIASSANMDGEVFGNLDKAAAIMEECWRGRRRQSSTPWSWTTAMSNLGLKALLI